jgi:hypothetical protein
MRTLILLCSVAILTATGLAASTLPEPAAPAAVITAPAAALPAACQAGAPAVVGQAAATALPVAAKPSASILRSLGGTPGPFWALGGDCWGQFSSCRTSCGGNTLCQEGCECVYCACAGLLCPNYCGSGQN